MRLFQLLHAETEGTIVCLVRRVADGYEMRLICDGSTQCRLRCRSLADALKLANRWQTTLSRNGWRSAAIQ